MPERHERAKVDVDDGGVAQLGEHLPCKQGVMSSNLTISTRHRDMSESLSE